MTNEHEPVIVSNNGQHSTDMETDVAEEKRLMVAKSLMNMIDNHEAWLHHDLSEDVYVDWFGRSVQGREHVFNFFRSHIPKTRHTIERVSKIPPINHRFIERLRGSTMSPKSQKKLLTEECGQGDCKGLSTPENVVLPNLKELVKAPRKKPLKKISFDVEKCQFLEIKGRLEFEFLSRDKAVHHSDKKLERIIVGYTDQIHIIVYEAKRNCRKKLSSLFNSAAE